ncbi:hypothetical protein BDV19DRAFT_394114 [Aspergillus venezuelensis]
MSRHQPLAPRGPLLPGAIPINNSSRITKSTRTKTTRACDKCRLLRKRCNGATPCENCSASKIACEYSQPDGRGREDWKAQVKALEERNAYLEQLVQQLSVNRADGAVHQPNPFIDQSLDAIQQRRQQEEEEEEEEEPPAAAQQALPEHPQLEASASVTTSGRIASGDPAREQSASEEDLQRIWVQLNQRHKLPEKHVTQQALGAFFQCAATLFYVTTEEKASRLLDNVYDSDTASIQDICELCALAAIGSHYKVDVIPDEARGNYFFIASTGLHEAIEAEGIQGMRIFICLCMSMVMEKSSIARLLIGKMVANLQAQRTASAGSQDDEHRRTLQTLLFLEGWLSYSLGYRSCLNKTEIDLVHYTIPLNQTENASALTTPLIQSHMTRLTLLASEIHNQIYTRRTTKHWSRADMLSMRLDTWHQSLPPDLHLAALTIGGDSPSPAQRVSVLQERALYLMHMFRSVFDACVVLLLTACQRFAVKSPATTSVTDISPHMETCLAVLAFCGRRDVVAVRLRDMLDPVFRGLIEMNTPTRSSSGSSSNPESEARSHSPGLPMGQGAIQADGEDGQEEMRFEYVLDRSPPTGSTLVKLTRRLLDMMSPGGNIWI